MQTSGEVVVLTGALGGLGTAMTRRLARGGRTVLACDRREGDADEWREALDPDVRERVRFVPLDVTKEAQIQRLREELREEGIRVQHLIHNAGIQVERPIEEFPSDHWELVLAVNLHGAFYLTRSFLGDIRAGEHGRIINISSLYAYQPGANQPAYAASKAALIGLTRSIARDVADEGVTVNAIAPGIIMHERLHDEAPQQALEAVDEIPAGRAGRPEEIAATVSFLLSREAGYMTGQVLHVNGGWYMAG